MDISAIATNVSTSVRGNAMNPEALILGVESSCDETAAAVVSGAGRVLSSIVSSQVPVHARYGGVIPELASRNHLMAVRPVVAEALIQAGVALGDLAAIGVTRGPGLLGSLLVGVQFAKGLAAATGLDLIPVHHVEGHITAVLLEDGAEHPHGPLEFPYMALAVSGGHTSVYLVREPGRYELKAVTLDDAAGEAFDKVARLLGLPYPGGVQIDRLAKQGRVDAVNFPRPLLPGRPGKAPNRNFSFSGLKTAVRVFSETQARLDEKQRVSMPDVAASFQEAVVDVLVRKTFLAAQAAGAVHVVLSGGVAANSRLRARAVEAAAEAGLKIHLTRIALCTDNAAMIAGAARFGSPVTGNELLALEPFASGQLVDC